MFNKLKLFLLSGAVAMSTISCGSGYGGYVATIRSARTTLPIAVEIERQFGSADHFITHYGFRTEKTNIWNTEVFFGGRYTLTMQVEIEIDYGRNTFKPVADPKFYLLETLDVDSRTEQVHTRFSHDFKFSLEEWMNVYKNKCNFSVIGIDLNNEPVADFDAYIHARRSPRVPVITLIGD